MSKIDALIQQLQEKKKKLDYLAYVKDLLSGDQKCVDYIEVQEEVLTKLIPLIDKLALEIEDSVEGPSKPVSVGDLGQEDLSNLKMLAEKLKAGKSKIQDTHETPKVPHKKEKKDHLPNQDKMSFAMDNRHLANKKVRVMAPDSEQIVTTGTVVGLDAPNVIVKTVEGPTIDVPLNKILLGETA